MKETRIVLVGKTGVGKSATGNTILGIKAFHQQASSTSVTKKCKIGEHTVNGRHILVVDSPGLCDTELPEEVVIPEIITCIDKTSPGPHVFLLVASVGRFTQEEVYAVKKVQEIFGDGALKFMMVLFTRGDDLEEGIEEYVANGQKELKKCIEKCGGRYHVFNNKDKKNREQVTTLLKKIDDMVKENGGGCFTNLMYKTVEEHKTKEANLEKDKKNTEDEMKKKEEQLLEKISKIDQERKNQSLSESNLNEQLSQLSLQTSEETEEEGKAHEEKGDEKGGVAYLKRVFEIEQQRKAEQAMHRKRMQEAELQMKIATAQHQQKMEDERQNLEIERLKMLREHASKIKQIERAIIQAKAEKEEWLRKNLQKKTKGCTIS